VFAGGFVAFGELLSDGETELFRFSGRGFLKNA
jgi:hypothetical protein